MNSIGSTADTEGAGKLAPRQRRLLIVDQKLRSYEGHSYNYDLAVVKAACGAGFDVTKVFGHPDISLRQIGCSWVEPVPQPALFRGLGWLANRWFPSFPSTENTARGKPRDYSLAPQRTPPRWLLRNWIAIRGFEFALSLRQILRSSSYCSEDLVHVFIQHADFHEIQGIETLRFLVSRSILNNTVFHLVVRHAPEAIVAKSTSLTLLAETLNGLGKSSYPTVRFYTDSDVLCSMYRRLTGSDSQFALLPIPVCFDATDYAPSVPQVSSLNLRLSMLGSARMEKGFGDIERLLEHLEAEEINPHPQLAIQITRASPDPRVRSVIARLDERVQGAKWKNITLQLLDGPVAEDIYLSWLARTDILLAPYSSPKYLASTSGVFVEALTFGIPVIALRDTWMALQIANAASNGLRIGAVAKRLEDFPAHVKAIASQLSDYRTDIAMWLKGWSEFNCADQLVRILRDGAVTTNHDVQ